MQESYEKHPRGSELPWATHQTPACTRVSSRAGESHTPEVIRCEQSRDQDRCSAISLPFLVHFSKVFKVIDLLSQLSTAGAKSTNVLTTTSIYSMFSLFSAGVTGAGAGNGTWKDQRSTMVNK